MLDLAFCNQVLPRPGDVFDRHLHVDSVLVEEIDAIGPKALQARVGDRADALRSAVCVSARGPSADRHGYAFEVIEVGGIKIRIRSQCGALTQFNVSRMIDRNSLKRVFVPVSIVLAPAMLALSFAQGWLVLPFACVVAASLFGHRQRYDDGPLYLPCDARPNLLGALLRPHPGLRRRGSAGVHIV